jgi:segregation and condensation protein B
VIASLRDKGLVREVGRAGGKAGAIMYGTTKVFLERFGLRSLADLPPLEDFAPDEQARQFIRERLSGRAISSTLEEAAADIDDERELLGDYGTQELDAEFTAEDAEMPEEVPALSAWADDWEDGVDD